MFVLAEEKNLILAEAMTIWHMPIYKKLWETVRSGSLGKVQMITMNFGSFKEYNMNNRFFNMNLAGGAMLDIGVYALSMHSKQPKRAMISCEKGYIEIMEYPRADKAVIVDAETGKKLRFPAVTLPMHCFMRWRIWNIQFLHMITPVYI